MNVGIFGLGYVGVVNAACFSKLGHYVTGCDIKEQKVESLKKGISPIYEPRVNELLKEALDKNLLSASTNASDVVMKSDVLLICVGTPSNENGEVNLDYIYNTTKEIAQSLNTTSKSISIAYRSTIPPNTLENFIRKIYKDELKNYKGQVKLAFYPEFLREGKAVDDFFNAPRIVIGTEEKEINQLEELLSYNSSIPVFKTNTVTAEFVKYVDNCFHALKVTYVNEIYEVGKQFGIDVAAANEIFLVDKSLNISPTYLRPGMPFGGSCLPKDLRAVNSMARAFNLKLPLLDSLLASNKQSLLRVMELIKATQKKKLLFVGFTFKNNTDDYRESPVLLIIEELRKMQYEIAINDEDINMINLRIDKPSIVKLVNTDLKDAISKAEVVVVTKRYLNKVLEHSSSDKVIINCTGKKERSAKNIIELY
jgi:GDP-mannose 6-dehydrogenase